MLSTAMNAFFGHERIVGNLPADAEPTGGRIEHPVTEPAKLRTLRVLSSSSS